MPHFLGPRAAGARAAGTDAVRAPLRHSAAPPSSRSCASTLHVAMHPVCTADPLHYLWSLIKNEKNSENSDPRGSPYSEKGDVPVTVCMHVRF